MAWYGIKFWKKIIHRKTDKLLYHVCSGQIWLLYKQSPRLRFCTWYRQGSPILLNLWQVLADSLDFFLFTEKLTNCYLNVTFCSGQIGLYFRPLYLRPPKKSDFTKSLRGTGRVHQNRQNFLIGAFLATLSTVIKPETLFNFRSRLM